jgi:hypothetical protein
MLVMHMMLSVTDFVSVSVDLDIPYDPVTYNILDIDSKLKYYAD